MLVILSNINIIILSIIGDTSLSKKGLSYPFFGELYPLFIFYQMVRILKDKTSYLIGNFYPLLLLTLVIIGFPGFSGFSTPFIIKKNNPPEGGLSVALTSTIRYLVYSLNRYH